MKLLDELVPTEALDIQDTLDIGSTLSGYLIELRRKPEAPPYPCARFSGATRLNEKPLGRKS